MPFKSLKFSDHERLSRYICWKFCPDSVKFTNAIQSLVLMSSEIVPDELWGNNLTAANMWVLDDIKA